MFNLSDALVHTEVAGTESSGNHETYVFAVQEWQRILLKIDSEPSSLSSSFMRLSFLTTHVRVPFLLSLNREFSAKKTFYYMQLEETGK